MEGDACWCPPRGSSRRRCAGYARESPHFRESARAPCGPHRGRRTCPMTTGIFLSIIAGAAAEQLRGREAPGGAVLAGGGRKWPAQSQVAAWSRTTGRMAPPGRSSCLRTACAAPGRCNSRRNVACTVSCFSRSAWGPARGPMGPTSPLPRCRLEAGRRWGRRPDTSLTGSGAASRRRPGSCCSGRPRIRPAWRRFGRHMTDIAARFAAGDFRLPGFRSCRPVPGTTIMAERRALIEYVADMLPRGGEVRIRTTDPSAVAAVHEFLAFQRQDHRVGDQHSGHGKPREVR